MPPPNLLLQLSKRIKTSPHPSRMRPAFEGLSHGGKTVHRTVFCSAFRVCIHIPRKRSSSRMTSFLVREMGLEPTRRSHTHLKRACLPFQHSRERLVIISRHAYFVNGFFPLLETFLPSLFAHFLPFQSRLILTMFFLCL